MRSANIVSSSSISGSGSTTTTLTSCKYSHKKRGPILDFFIKLFKLQAQVQPSFVKE